MSEEENKIAKQRTIKDIANTPFKKIMLGVQFLSWFLIVGSPVIGGVISKTIQLNGAKTAGLILGIFIAGEVLFYGSLAFLGKELIVIIKDKFKRKVSRKISQDN